MLEQLIGFLSYLGVYDAAYDETGGSKDCCSNGIEKFCVVLALMVDVADFVFDYIFVKSLSDQGEPGYAALMGIMTTLSVILLHGTKIQLKAYREDEEPLATRLSLLFSSEIFIFLMEDATTILIFTRVADVYDGGTNLTSPSAINAWLTLLSGITATIGFVVNQVGMVRQGGYLGNQNDIEEGRTRPKLETCCALGIYQGAMISGIGFHMYLLIDYVLLGGGQLVQGVMKGLSLAFYVLFYAVFGFYSIYQACTYGCIDYYSQSQPNT